MISYPKTSFVVWDAFELRNEDVLICGHNNWNNKNYIFTQDSIVGLFTLVDKEGKYKKQAQYKINNMPTYFHCVIKEDKDSILIVGYNRTQTSSENHILLIWINKNLDILSIKDYYISALEFEVKDAIVNQQGEIILIGGINTDMIDQQKRFPFVYKFSQNLDSLKFSTYPWLVSYTGYSLGIRIFEFPVSNNYLCQIYLDPENNDIGPRTLLYLDSTLAIKESIRINAFGDISFNIFPITPNELYYLGTGIVEPFFTSPLILSKINLKDSLLCRVTLAKRNYKHIDPIEINFKYNNYIYVCGVYDFNWGLGTLHSSESPTEVFISLVDTNCGLRWSKFVSEGEESPASYYPTAVVATKDSGVMVVGIYRKLSPFNRDPFYDLFTIKIKPDGGGVVTATTNLNDEYLNEVLLYPNPATHMIEIPINTFGVFELTDLAGRSILRSNEKRISVGHLPRGMYYYNWIGQGGKRKSGKLVLE